MAWSCITLWPAEEGREDILNRRTLEIVMGKWSWSTRTQQVSPRDPLRPISEEKLNTKQEEGNKSTRKATEAGIGHEKISTKKNSREKITLPRIRRPLWGEA